MALLREVRRWPQAKREDNRARNAYKPRVETAELEQALRDFDRVATFLRDEPGRQIWLFRYAEKDYHFYFYPRIRKSLRKQWTQHPINEFARLQALQRSGTPAPRAVANLSGFRISGVLGDALIIEPI